MEGLWPVEIIVQMLVPVPILTVTIRKDRWTIGKIEVEQRTATVQQETQATRSDVAVRRSSQPLGTSSGTTQLVRRRSWFMCLFVFAGARESHWLGLAFHWLKRVNRSIVGFWFDRRLSTE